MRYMMFIASDTEPDTTSEVPDLATWIADLDARQKGVIGDRLRPISDATLVRVRNGEVLVTDGPYTESKEWILGFDVLDCDDLDEAIDIAAGHPMAYTGRIELRPFWPLGED